MATSNPFTSRDVGHVVKFDGTYFPLWKFQICLTITQHDLMGIIDGSSKPPLPTVNADGDITNEAAVKKWKLQDNTAQCFIAATIEQDKLRTLMTCKSARDMWLRLTSQYEQTAAENKYFLQQRFYEYKFQDGHDISSHVTTVEALANQLIDLGVNIDEMQAVKKIICTLPPSFRHIVSVWDNLEDSKKSLESLTSRLLKEETQNKSYGKAPKEDAAFFAPKQFGRSNQPKESSSSGDHHQTSTKSRRKKKCTFCSNDVHLEEHCWTKKRIVRELQAKASSKANLARHVPQSLPKNGRPSFFTDDYAFTSRLLALLSKMNVSRLGIKCTHV